MKRRQGLSGAALGWGDEVSSLGVRLKGNTRFAGNLKSPISHFCLAMISFHCRLTFTSLVPHTCIMAQQIINKLEALRTLVSDIS